MTGKTLAKGFRVVECKKGQMTFSPITITWHHQHGEIQQAYPSAEDVKATLPTCNAYWSSPKQY